MAARRRLPVWAHREALCKGLRDKDVMVVIEETGSGQSTQIPQFLLNEPWCKRMMVDIERGDCVKLPMPVGGVIAITEPRRVAAITLARRMAEELGTPLGKSSPQSKVGYSVRFEKSLSPCTVSC